MPRRAAPKVDAARALDDWARAFGKPRGQGTVIGRLVTTPTGRRAKVVGQQTSGGHPRLALQYEDDGEPVLLQPELCKPV